MNMILLSPGDISLDGGSAVLTGRRHGHILSVLKSGAGDTLNVGLLNGKIGKAVLKHIDEKQAELGNISLTFDPPACSNVTLVLALPRPLAVKRILQAVTTLGVKRIFLIGSNRVEKSYWKSPVLSGDNIREQLMLGLEQAKDTTLPEVHLRPLFKAFVEDELGPAARGSKIFIAHPGAEKRLVKCDGKVTLIVGPEGGFIPYEILKFREKGAEPVCGSERILKVETAVTAFISLFSL